MENLLNYLSNMLLRHTCFVFHMARALRPLRFWFFMYLTLYYVSLFLLISTVDSIYQCSLILPLFWYLLFLKDHDENKVFWLINWPTTTQVTHQMSSQLTDWHLYNTLFSISFIEIFGLFFQKIYFLFFSIIWITKSNCHWLIMIKIYWQLSKEFLKKMLQKFKKIFKKIKSRF